jgi:hypothetical protein
LGLAPILKSPDTLSDRAQDLVHKFGFNEAPRDTAFWFQRNYAFLFRRSKQKSKQLGDIKSAEQGHEKFFYRQSPRGLFPMNFSMTVNYSTPATDVSGMVTVVLQTDGKLDEFLEIPPQAAGTSPPPTTAVDWAGLFSESGLDLTRFRQEAPSWNAPVPFDASMGWKGSYPQTPGDIVHVVAAAFRGRPVYFKVIGSWSFAERDLEDTPSKLQTATSKARRGWPLSFWSLACCRGCFALTISHRRPKSGISSFQAPLLRSGHRRSRA